MLKFFYKVLRKFNLIKYFNFIFKISYDGTFLKVPVISGLGFDNLDKSEIWMGQLLEFLELDSNKTFVDVGINVGQTLIKYKSVYPLGSYVGFEPNSSCIFYVYKLIEENQYKNVNIFPVGLAENTSIIPLNIYGELETDPSASAVKNFRPHAKIFKELNIPVFDFNTLNITLTDVCVIKIDVEGMENVVLKTLESVLKKEKPVVIMEILPIYSDENEDRVNLTNEITEIMLNLHGYEMFRILKNTQNEFDGLFPIESIEIHSDLTKCDYLFKSI